jgi:hypothetical protein
VNVPFDCCECFKPAVGGIAEYKHQLCVKLAQMGDNVLALAPPVRERHRFDREVSFQVLPQLPSRTGFGFGQRFQELVVFERLMVSFFAPARPTILERLEVAYPALPDYHSLLASHSWNVWVTGCELGSRVLT